MIIRLLIMGPNFDLKEAVLEKGNVAAAICEAGTYIDRKRERERERETRRATLLLLFARPVHHTHTHTHM